MTPEAADLLNKMLLAMRDAEDFGKPLTRLDVTQSELDALRESGKQHVVCAVDTRGFSVLGLPVYLKD